MIAKGTAQAHDAEAKLHDAEEELAALRAEVEKLRKSRPPDLTQLYKDIKRKYTRFITDKVNPGYRERHQGDLSSWTPELFREAGSMGLIGLGASKEIGGDGLDPYSTGIVLEEIAKLSNDPGLPILMVMNKRVATILAIAGREDLLESFARPLIRGEFLGTWASWEDGDMGYMKSEARRVDGGWELSGTKPFVTGATLARCHLVLLREQGTDEPILFIVKSDDPGVKVTPFDTVGARYLGFGVLTMNKVKIPEDRLVLDTDVFATCSHAFDEEIWNLTGVHLGWMQRMYHLGIEFLGPKVRGGMKFLDIPHVQSEMGRLYIGIEAARSFFLRNLDRYLQGKNDPHNDPFTVAAKYFMAERTMDTAKTLMKLLGSAAYLDENPWGSYFTHVVCLFHVMGTQDLIPQQLGERYLAELEMKKLRKFTM